MTPMGVYPRPSAEERFFAKVLIPKDPDGCWFWTAGKIKIGYGHFTVGGRTVKAHRWSWEHANGPIPPGLQVDHLCRVRHCVRPDHLELVTPKENSRRGLYGVLKSHCANGHPWTEENILEWPSQRTCRVCRSGYDLRRRTQTRKTSGPTGRDKTHCIRGHRLSGDNLMDTRGSKRICKACRRVRAQRDRDAGHEAIPQKTHCIHGHPYEEDNTYIDPRGARSCRTCQRERVRRKALRQARS